MMQPIQQPPPSGLEDAGAKGVRVPGGNEPGADFGAQLAQPVGPAAVAGPAAAVGASEAAGAAQGVAPAQATGAEWLRAPEALDSLMQFVATRGAELQPFELIALQMRVHEITFQVETASKAIEHGMHGAKSLLQTQA